SLLLISKYASPTSITSRVAPLKSVLYTNRLPGRRMTRELSGSNANRFAVCSAEEAATRACPISSPALQKAIPSTSNHIAAIEAYIRGGVIPLLLILFFRPAASSLTAIQILAFMRSCTRSSSFGSSASQSRSSATSCLYHCKRRSRSASLAVPCKYFRISRCSSLLSIIWLLITEYHTHGGIPI